MSLTNTRQSLGYACGDEPIRGYRLVTHLGAGQFGEVWKAEAPGGFEVALKIMDLARQEGRKEYEAIQSFRKVNSPHLTRLHACWLVDGNGRELDTKGSIASLGPEEETIDQPLAASGGWGATRLVVAMDLGEKCLHKRLEECRTQGAKGIPVEELIDYMSDAAKGIDYLHRPIHDIGEGPHSIVHRDIKPRNILVVGEGAQVCDFGLARAVAGLHDSIEKSKTATLSGTIGYMAPELLDGLKATPRTDQYALAITYAELRIGRLPYQSVGELNALAVIRQAVEGTHDLSEFETDEQRVLTRALNGNPAKRFKSCSEMVAALRAAVDGLICRERREQELREKLEAELRQSLDDRLGRCFEELKSKLAEESIHAVRRGLGDDLDQDPREKIERECEARLEILQQESELELNRQLEQDVDRKLDNLEQPLDRDRRDRVATNLKATLKNELAVRFQELASRLKLELVEELQRDIETERKRLLEDKRLRELKLQLERELNERADAELKRVVSHLQKELESELSRGLERELEEKAGWDLSQRLQQDLRVQIEKDLLPRLEPIERQLESDLKGKFQDALNAQFTDGMNATGVQRWKRRLEKKLKQSLERELTRRIDKGEKPRLARDLKSRLARDLTEKLDSLYLQFQRELAVDPERYWKSRLDRELEAQIDVLETRLEREFTKKLQRQFKGERQRKLKEELAKHLRPILDRELRGTRLGELRTSLKADLERRFRKELRECLRRIFNNGVHDQLEQGLDRELKGALDRELGEQFKANLRAKLELYLDEELEASEDRLKAEIELLERRQEKLEQEKLEQERLEQERLEQERLEQEKREQEKREQEKREQEKREQEKREQEKLEQEKLEQEKLEQEPISPPATIAAPPIVRPELPSAPPALRPEHDSQVSTKTPVLSWPAYWAAAISVLAGLVFAGVYYRVRVLKPVSSGVRDRIAQGLYEEAIQQVRSDTEIAEPSRAAIERNIESEWEKKLQQDWCEAGSVRDWGVLHDECDKMLTFYPGHANSALLLARTSVSMREYSRAAAELAASPSDGLSGDQKTLLAVLEFATQTALIENDATSAELRDLIEQHDRIERPFTEGFWSPTSRERRLLDESANRVILGHVQSLIRANDFSGAAEELKASQIESGSQYTSASADLWKKWLKSLQLRWTKESAADSPESLDLQLDCSRLAEFTPAMADAHLLAARCVCLTPTDPTVAQSARLALLEYDKLYGQDTPSAQQKIHAVIEILANHGLPPESNQEIDASHREEIESLIDKYEALANSGESFNGFWAPCPFERKLVEAWQDRLDPGRGDVFAEIRQLIDDKDYTEATERLEALRTQVADEDRLTLNALAMIAQGWAMLANDTINQKELDDLDALYKQFSKALGEKYAWSPELPGRRSSQESGSQTLKCNRGLRSGVESTHPGAHFCRRSVFAVGGRCDDNR